MSETPVAAERLTRSNLPELSVSELSQALKRNIEQNFSYVRVRGEISGLKRHSSGHVYLTLKDEDANLDGVIWRGTVGRIQLQPADGYRRHRRFRQARKDRFRRGRAGGAAGRGPRR